MSDAELLEMHASGMTWNEITRKTGIPFETARKRVRRYKKTLGNNNHTAPKFEGLPQDLPSLDELFKLARASQNVIDRVDPVITNKTITIKTDKSIGIIFASCAHLGSRYAFYEKFEEIFNKVLDTDGLYYVSLGDDVEGFTGGFPDASAVTDQAIAKPQVQRLMLTRVLEMLVERRKLLAGTASQHGGKWSESKVGDNPIKELYLRHKIPFFDGKALVTLNVGNETYNIAMAHELPGNSSGNPNHAQGRAALYDFPNEDVIVSGDKHKYSVQELSLPTHEYDAGIRKTYMQYRVQVGTAKTGNDKYAIKWWSRGVLEWPVLIFAPDRHEIVYTRNLDIAQLLLEQWR